MVSSVKNILAFTIILSGICSAFSLQCYYCDSSRDQRCGEKFDAQDNFKIDCSRLQQQLPQSNFQYNPFSIPNATGCVKKILNDSPGHPRFERSCFFGDLSRTGAGCNTPNSQFSLLRCDVCTGDLCNGSSSIAPIGFAIVLFIGLARLLA